MNTSHAKFKQIYTIYNELLYGIGLSVLKDKELALDAMQNCYERVYKHIDAIGNVDAKETQAYVAIIMKNEARRCYNKSKFYEEKNIPFEDNIHLVKEAAPDTAEIFANADLQQHVHLCLNQLKPDDRDILILKFDCDLTDKEIASSLGVSNATIRKRLERARKRMAAIIASKGGMQNVGG